MSNKIGEYEILQPLPSDDIYGWAIARSSSKNETVVLQYLKLSPTPEQLDRLKAYFKNLGGISRPALGSSCSGA